MGYYEVKEKKILFYGAGTIANLLYQELGLAHASNFTGFIDLRGAQLGQKNGHPVYTIEETEQLEEKNSYVIVITTRDVFEHNKIAHVFFDQGFHNLIFKPFSTLKGEGTPLLQEIYHAHNVFHSEFKVPTQKIPSYTTKDLPRCKESGIIEQCGDRIKMYLPAALLFTNAPVKNYPTMAIHHCHFASCYFAVDFYRALAQSTPEAQEDIAIYVEEIGRVGAELCGTDTSGQWESLLIQARQNVYEEMNRSLALDFDFFLRYPTTVSFNEQGQLALVASGKNRVSFLISKGYDYIPAYISKEDYESLIQKEAFQEVETLFAKEEVTSLFAPVPHPYFYNFPVIASNYNSFFLDRVAHQVGRYLRRTTQFFRFDTICTLSCLEDEGAAARYFQTLGSKVSTLGETTLQMALNRLCQAEIALWKEGDEISLLLLSNRTEPSVFAGLLEQQPPFVACLQWENQQPLDMGPYEEKVLFQTVWDKTPVKGVFYQNV